jgi:adenylate cyclase
MAQGDGPVYRFSGRVLDLGRGILSDAAGRIDLRPKSLALLVYMVRNAGRVISRDELMKAVWPDVIVGDDSLTQCIRDVRRALGDDAQTLVRTIARRGYIFDAAFLEPDEDPEPTALGFGETRPLLDPRLPRVAVLPFALDGENGAGAGAYFADGFVEDVVTGLARFRWLFVIAPTSSLTFRGPLHRRRSSPAVARPDAGLCPAARRRDRNRPVVRPVRRRVRGRLRDPGSACDRGGHGADRPDPRRRDRPGVLEAAGQPRCLRPFPAGAARSARMRPEDNEHAIALARRALAAEPDYAAAAGLAGWALSLRVAQGWRRDERERGAAVELG